MSIFELISFTWRKILSEYIPFRSIIFKLLDEKFNFIFFPWMRSMILWQGQLILKLNDSIDFFFFFEKFLLFSFFLSSSFSTLLYAEIWKLVGWKLCVFDFLLIKISFVTYSTMMFWIVLLRLVYSGYLLKHLCKICVRLCIHR